MNKKIIYLLFIVLISCQGKQSDTSADKLFEIFRDPPTEARPFVRWWWNGDCVEEKEIIRELDIMKNAGIGEVEINPIAMPEHDLDIHCECHEWLSDEWNRLIKRTIEEATDRDMIVDLIIGSGWPFGGRFLEKEESIQGVGFNKIKLLGPSIYHARIEDILQPPGRRDRGAFEEADPAELFFLRLVPSNASGTVDVIDVMDSVDENGNISIEVPAGTYELMAGSYQYGFRAVSYGAPGSDGPVLDHMNKQAVAKYLNRLSDALEAVLGGKLGDHIRSIFCDSIELSGANWTNDFKQEFIKRNGYDIDPWLPFIFYYAYEGYTDTLDYQPAFNDSILRVRYDFNTTIIDLFLERFTRTLHDWANEHGTKSRYQAYGMPWLVGISEGYMIPDIPESNNWLYTWDGAKYHGFWIWNKYTSSSAHLTGKPVISSESMTNTRGVFQTTLEIFKWNDDFNFITGINHSVLHGFNYSPPEAGFPGWIRFGTYLSENNTWWPHFKLWSDYNSRLSALFQVADPVSEIAILAPFADRYSETGLYRIPIHAIPWYAHDLWEACSQLGYNADYINEKVICDADFSDGTLNYGPMTYQLLFVAGARSLNPETVEALEQFAGEGGKIIFIETLPERSSSLVDMENADRTVRETINRISVSRSVELIQPPEEDKKALLSWTREILERHKITSTVSISDPDINLYQIHCKYGQNQIYFFSNQEHDETIRFNALFTVPNGYYPWIWLPEKGQRFPYPFSDDPGKVQITLDPLESILIVYDNQTSKKHFKVNSGISVQDEPVETEWNIEFQHINGDSFSVTSNELFDFASSEDSRIREFAGTVTYTGTIKTDSENYSIDLGDVSGGVTELFVDEQKVGTKWYGRHIYELGGLTTPGQHQIKIVYTTILANYTLSLKESRVAQNWTSIEEPMSQGIIGPVIIGKNEE